MIVKKEKKKQEVANTTPTEMTSRQFNSSRCQMTNKDVHKFSDDTTSDDSPENDCGLELWSVTETLLQPPHSCLLAHRSNNKH